MALDARCNDKVTVTAEEIDTETAIVNLKKYFEMNL